MKLKAKNFNEARSISYPRGKFDMSHSWQGTYDIGILYPIFWQETMPSDRWDLAQAMQATMMPTVSPVKHQIDVRYHYFWMPYNAMRRIVSGEANTGFDNINFPCEYPYHNAQFDKFIGGGFHGEDTQQLITHHTTMNDQQVGSLWDHLGLPMNIDPDNYANVKIWPACFRMYQEVYNNYFRDETQQDAVNMWASDENQYNLRVLNWEKDYFTAAQKTQQRGIAPAIPVEGVAAALWDHVISLTPSGSVARFLREKSSTTDVEMSGAAGPVPLAINPKVDELNDNEIDIEGLAIASDMLRLQFATQRFLERNMRNGVRPSEFIWSHFNDGPTNSELDIPQYIGGWRQQIMTQEVIQTSETNTTAQGTRTGVGAAHGAGKIGTWHAKNFGIIMGFMSIMPRAMYTQGQKPWVSHDRTRLDFPFPEFANLSERAIPTKELFTTGDDTDNEIFGYQGQYDEYRQQINMAVGLMRQTTDGLASWNLARNFATAPALNSEFLEVEVQELKNRIFVATGEPGFVITSGNICTADRPIPEIAEPGLLDHV